MVHASPSSKYMRTISAFLARKRALELDAWGRYPHPSVAAALQPLADHVDAHCPTSRQRYPTTWTTERRLARLVCQIHMSACVQDEFAALFAGMSVEELDECARSFSFAECVQREGLNRQLEAHAEVEAFDKGWERPTNVRPDLGEYDFAQEQE